MTHPTHKWIPLKQWLAEQAQELGITDRAVYMRVKRGLLRQPKTKKINPRVVMVRV